MFMKPSGVKADASKKEAPSTKAPGKPMDAGLTGAKLSTKQFSSPKAQRRYSDKGVGRMSRG